LDEIDAFATSLKNCPKCGSSEGFWLAADRERSYVQCKQCAAILEICQVFPGSGKEKGSKSLFSLKLKLKDF
jgi:ribosomal protein S27AE